MYVDCETCGKCFDNEHKWTNCPHRHLWLSPHRPEEPYPHTTIRLSDRQAFWIGVAIAAAAVMFICWMGYQAIAG